MAVPFAVSDIEGVPLWVAPKRVQQTFCPTGLPGTDA